MSVELSGKVLKRLGYTRVSFRSYKFGSKINTVAFFPDLKSQRKKGYCKVFFLLDKDKIVQFETELKFETELNSSYPAIASECLPLYEEILRLNPTMLLWVLFPSMECLKVKVIKQTDNPNLLVVIGKDVYEMNEDAHLPNGLNMFLCGGGGMGLEKCKRVGLSILSQGMKIAIHKRMEQKFFDLEDE